MKDDTNTALTTIARTDIGIATTTAIETEIDTPADAGPTLETDPGAGAHEDAAIPRKTEASGAGETRPTGQGGESQMKAEAGEIEIGTIAGREGIGPQTAPDPDHLAAVHHEEGSIPESVVKADRLRVGQMIAAVISTDRHAGISQTRKMTDRDTMAGLIREAGSSSQTETTKRRRKSVPRSWLLCKRLPPTWTKLARSGSRPLRKRSGRRERPMRRRASRIRSIVEVMLGL